MNLDELKTLDALLKVGLVDLKLVEQDPFYDVNMDRSWHERSSNGETVCYVCLAGSVMAKSLGATLGKDYDPSDFDLDTSKKLYALDSLREGEVGQAVRQMPGYTYTTRTWNKFFDCRVSVPPYSRGTKSQWWRAMYDLSAFLEYNDL